MILAALFAAAAIQAVPMEVRLQDGAAWTLRAEQRHELQDRAKTEAWTLTTEKRLTWRKGGFTRNAELTISPLSATASPDAPKDLLRKRVFPQPVALEVDFQLSPTRLVDEKPARAAYAALGLGPANAKSGEIDREIAAMVARDLAMVARAQGRPLIPGQPQEYAPSVATPLGGIPAKGKASYRLESHDPAAGRAVVTWRQTVEPAAYRDAFAQMVAFTAKGKAEGAEAIAARLGKIEASRDDSCRYDIDLPTGLVVKAVCDARFAYKSEGGESISSDHWVITQTLPEAR